MFNFLNNENIVNLTIYYMLIFLNNEDIVNLTKYYMLNFLNNEDFVNLTKYYLPNQESRAGGPVHVLICIKKYIYSHMLSYEIVYSCFLEECKTSVYVLSSARLSHMLWGIRRFLCQIQSVSKCSNVKCVLQMSQMRLFFLVIKY